VVFYLNVLPEALVERNFSKNQSLDFWESGMDLGLSRDMFDSFLQYQSLVAAKFKELQATYGFTIVDGHRTPDQITLELRKRIESVLAGK
jgi:dTMP kinase